MGRHPASGRQSGALRLGGGGQGALRFRPSSDIPRKHERFGGMEVTQWQLKPDTAETDLHYLRMAVAESRKCTPCATSYCVGAIIVACDGAVFRGYTHETSPTHHAEQEAIAKALAAGADLARRGDLFLDGTLWRTVAQLDKMFPIEKNIRYIAIFASHN